MVIRRTARARSLGLKLLLVGALAFLLWIPAMFIYALVWERSTRADEVRDEIYDLRGGRQTISGPIIVAPALIDTGKFDAKGAPVVRPVAVVFTPRVLDIAAKAETSTRRRSIFDATVYDAEVTLRGRFAPLVAPKPGEGELRILWDKAAIAVKFDSARSLKGLRGTLSVSLDGAPADLAFEPAVAVLQDVGEAGEDRFHAAGVSAPLGAAFDPGRGFSFDIGVPISGGGALFFGPVGEETTLSVVSNWPDPSFQGAFLPDERSIASDGFSARWTIPYLARNLPRSMISVSNLDFLDSDKAFGVAFVTTASPYQSVDRALKYALMFVGLILLTFFLFEATMGVRAHPAQYVLLGVAQVLFYLLVLAFSEHFAFERAFIGTAGATVLLSGLYAGTVFRSFWKGLLALTAFSAAYALIYLLMKTDDYALLIGSVTAFGAIALTMFVTRDLDWYGESVGKETIAAHGSADAS